jgi:aminopeptidase N
VASENHGRYRIESYSNKTEPAHPEAVINEAAALLDFYSNRWVPLRIHSLAVSPIPATFGQGFPGLIYLSDLSYVSSEDRPLNLQTPEYERFFSDLLLPHEIAHQWWGNLVTAADYRSAWIMEALANYSALQFVAQAHGAKESDELLDKYRNNLAQLENGKAREAYGPLEFGIRLVDLANAAVWHTILYEKGTWVMEMLHQRLGDEAFLKLETNLLHDYADRPITNEDLRQAASELMPIGQPDKTLTSFFETWVYGTGIPKIALKDGEVTVSGVDDDFTMDLPLRCGSKQSGGKVHWTRVDSGTTSLDLPPGNSCQLPAPNQFLYLPAS